MDTQKRRQAILYVEGGRLFFYPGPGDTMLQLAFPQDIMSDLEVLNPQKLLDLVLAFFQTQKIPPSEILCVFASVTVFEKDFSLDEKKEQIQQFLDYIPFDTVLSKQFIFNKKIHIFAINEQVYNIIRQACKKSDCLLAGVVAYGALTDMIPELAQKVNLPLILTKFDSCKQFSLESVSLQEMVTPNTTLPQKQNTRMYILLGVFGILVLVLVTMVFSTFRTSPTTTSVTTPRSLPVTPTRTIPIQFQRASSSSVLSH